MHRVLLLSALFLVPALASAQQAHFTRTNPPGSADGKKWKTMTATTARARSPSMSAR